MTFKNTNLLCASCFSAVVLVLCCAAPMVTEAGQSVALAKITIDYPQNGTVFPPEITAPTVLWREESSSAKRWVIEITFLGAADRISADTLGPPMETGTIDPQAGPMPDRTPEQAATHTWKPDEEMWAKIKGHSVHGPATIRILGFAADAAQASPAISSGTVKITTSADPVGAPLFYRDVPLMLPSPDQKGPISPLPQSAIPLIKWQMRNLAEPKSHVVMQNMPTCANCHSFSRDGKTFGLDLDGPRNDKGLYALVPVQKLMTIRNQNTIHWSSFELNSEASGAKPAVKRFGFMSQVSPDGRYVVTSIGPPDNANTHQNEEPGFASGILDRLYSTNYRSLQFSQVFYPTRGILAWYDSKEGKMRVLPGADDPQYVHTSAFWSPDGKYLIFSRALARDPYPARAPKPQFANDPNETQIQYDLYKIPFNDGRGGRAVPVLGASKNGMSNNFPKVSPDGRWIVWVQNKNGLLMRPDSTLWIVPFEGGKPRKMNCNLAPMNSWHTFSPNGHWLAFSSKSRGPYTRLMLTHIDADGNDTPAVIVDNTTAANRAVNIPEFVNMPVEGIEKINPEATDFYRLFDEAYKQIENNQIPAAIDSLRSAIAHDPSDALAHYVLATALSANDQEKEALDEYREATALNPLNAVILDHLAVSLDLNGDAAGAVAQLQKAVDLAPMSAEYRFNLAVVLESQGDFAGAVGPLQKSVELSRGKNWRAFAELAKALDKSGHAAEAVDAARSALNLAESAHDEQTAQALRTALDHYQQDSAASSPR